MNQSTESPTSVTPEELLEERERAISLLSFLPELKSYTIYCHRTGVAIATMNLLQQAGKLPYLSQWKDSVAYHPLFSLPQMQLLSWVRKNWNQLFRNTASDHITDVQKEQFQISFMAILHTMDCLDQQVPALPSFHTVNANMQRLLELAYWFNYLDSKRFKFPTLRINKLNANNNLHDIGAYLDICESRKFDWETSKEARFEDAKLEAARKAERAVRGTHIKAVSKKALWNWFLSSLAASNSKKYQLGEWVEWKEDAAKLWFASESAQLQFPLDDVEAIQDVFITECSLGTTVSHAFTKELDRIRQNISNHLKVFEIDWTATIGQSATRVDKEGNLLGSSSIEQSIPEEEGPEPLIQNYNSRSDFIRAQAKWTVKKMQRKAWIEKYGTSNVMEGETV